MDNRKCLVYYFDSKKYDYANVQESIDETKKEYNKKLIEVNVEINKYGMYVITIYIKNKNTFFNKIRLFFRKKNKPLLQASNNKEQEQEYGKYKCGILYHPY